MILVSLLLGILATSSLRLLAAFAGRFAGLNMVEYCACLTYGLLGALTARIVLLPVNELADLHWGIRLLVPAVSLLAYGWFKWGVLRALGCGVLVFAIAEGLAG